MNRRELRHLACGAPQMRPLCARVPYTFNTAALRSQGEAGTTLDIVMSKFRKVEIGGERGVGVAARKKRRIVSRANKFAETLLVTGVRAISTC